MKGFEKNLLYLHGTHRVLREIKLFYDAGEYEMAYDEAIEGFDDIDHVLPDAIWREIGGMFDEKGNKIKRRKLLKGTRWKMEYRKCLVLITLLKRMIKRLPPKGKLYSKPWLHDIYKCFLGKREFIKEIDYTKFTSAPEIDKQLIKECYKWLDKFKEHIDYWSKQKVSLDNEYDFLSWMTRGHEYFLKQRDKTGTGSFIDIMYFKFYTKKWEPRY